MPALKYPLYRDGATAYTLGLVALAFAALRLHFRGAHDAILGFRTSLVRLSSTNGRHGEQILWLPAHSSQRARLTNYAGRVQIGSQFEFPCVRGSVDNSSK